MNAVRMIHSISQYYNSSERMTSLFLKITNQMINTCKKYIKEGYGMTLRINKNKTINISYNSCLVLTGKLWDIPRNDLLERISESKKLFQEYQKNFHKTRDKLKSMENERQWDFRLVFYFRNVFYYLN